MTLLHICYKLRGRERQRHAGRGGRNVRKSMKVQFAREKGALALYIRMDERKPQTYAEMLDANWDWDVLRLKLVYQWIPNLKWYLWDVDQNTGLFLSLVLARVVLLGVVLVKLRWFLEVSGVPGWRVMTFGDMREAFMFTPAGWIALAGVWGVKFRKITKRLRAREKGRRAGGI